jgi:hypothetical protein
VVGSAIQFIGLFWQSLPRQSIDLYPEMRNCYKHTLLNCDSEDDANADLGKVASSNPIQSTSQGHLTQCKKRDPSEDDHPNTPLSHTSNKY